MQRSGTRAVRPAPEKSGWLLIFSWDPAKAAANVIAHGGVTFFEAKTVFDDPLAADLPDLEHSEDEPRFVTIGLSALRRLLVVFYAEAQPNEIRLISARRATPSERRIYEDGE